MIDLYCERLGPGLWAEPVNALTNLAFLFSAWAAWGLAKKHRAHSLDVWLLIALILLVGAGSGLFHTLATPWAHTLDVTSILAFQLVFLWAYFHRIIGIQPVAAAATVLAYLGIALLARQFPEVLNRSLSYAPAIVVLVVLGAYHYFTKRTERALLLVASLIFFVSLVFRTVDAAVCPYFPLGTHFLWHLFNAVLVFLLMKALLANVDRGQVPVSA